MKYLLLTLLLLGCSDEASNTITREQWNAQIEQGKAIIENSKDKCYLAWDGYIRRFEIDEGDTVGVKVCTVYKQCDYNNNKSCINAMTCSTWINYAMVAEQFASLKLKETSCPGRNK